MGKQDRQPLTDTPVSARIAARHPNRIGSVYSSLYGFWTARHTVTTRRDAYSVILFDDTPVQSVSNDFASTPGALLELVLPHGVGWGTNYAAALQTARVCMENNWSTER